MPNPECWLRLKPEAGFVGIWRESAKSAGPDRAWITDGFASQVREFGLHPKDRENLLLI